MQKTRRTVYKCAPDFGCGLSIKPLEERRIVISGRDVRRIHRKCYVRLCIPARIADTLSERELRGIEEVVWAFGPDTVEGMIRMTEHDWGDELSPELDVRAVAEGETLVGEYQRTERHEVLGQERDIHVLIVDGKREDPVGIWGSYDLDMKLPEHKGHMVRIENKGKRDIGGGRTKHTWSLKCRTCAQPQVG